MRTLAGLVLAMLALVGCSSGDAARTAAEPDTDTATAAPTTTAPETTTTSTTSSTTTTTTTTTTLPPFKPEAIAWEPCGRVECGTLAVPLDHDEPDGPTIDLAVQRLSAAIPGERIGSLFLNFGGPGGTSSSIFPGYAGLLAAGGFADRFDLVTWDTRGTVGSAPLACTSADLDAAADAVGLVDPSDGFDDELGDEREGFEFVIDCASRTPDLLDHIGTVSVAKDLDLLRQAVGDDALNYLGYSYGSEIGWVHATLFPDTIRTMILDGIVDPVSQRSGFVDQYAAFERTLEFFDEWCADVADCDNLLSGERLLDAVDRVAGELALQPLALADGSVFDEERFLHGVLSTLYLPPESIGTQLAFWVNRVDFGDGSGLAAFDDSGSLSPGVYEAVLCADGFRPQTEQDAIQLYADFLEAAPRFGQLNEVLLCDMWPGEVDPIPELNTSGAPTILVVANTLDPATPYEAAQRLDAALDESVLLTFDGAGHAIVGSDACIDGHALTYLEALVPPPSATVC